MLHHSKLVGALEAVLLVAKDPVPFVRLLEVVQAEDPEVEEDDVRTALTWLTEAYENPDRPLARGFRVEWVGDALRIRTESAYASFVTRFLGGRPKRLSRAALESLAVIAYRQPVTRSEIEAVRGVDAGGALKGLLDRELIRIVGKKEELGRPLIYGTTKQFLEFFGLRGLSDLPTLREYLELDDAHQEQVRALEEAASKSLAELRTEPDAEGSTKGDEEIEALERAVKMAGHVSEATDAVLLGDSSDDAAESTSTDERVVGSA